MNKISAILVFASIAVISACASDEAVMEDDMADEGMTTQQSATAMPETTTREKAMEEEESDEAAEPASTPETSSATDESGNLVSTCTKAGYERVISVVYDNEDTGNVCEVIYEKSSGVETLWSARNERDYCLDKAKAFVEKQQGWGWTCSNLE